MPVLFKPLIMIAFVASCVSAQNFTLYADGSIGCTGADDLSTPVGEVTVDVVGTTVNFTCVFGGAGANGAYTVQVSEEPSCSPTHFLSPSALVTDANGNGALSGSFVTVPGVHHFLFIAVDNIFVGTVFREIGTEDATVGVATTMYEGFDYPVGPLAGLGGGVNLGGVWAGGYPVASGGLSFENLLTTGNHITHVFNGYPYPGAFREFDDATYAGLAGSGEFWFSCLFNHNANAFYSYLVLRPLGMNVPQFQLRNDGLLFASGSHLKFGAFTLGQTAFMVGRISVTGPANDGANDWIRIWMDPTPGLSSPDTLHAIDMPFTFELLPNAGFSIATQFGGGSISIDEIRFGATYASVAPIIDPDVAPIADAGTDFSVNEGQTSVMLDGSASNDPNGDPLAYSWTQIAGTVVALSDASNSQPAFDSPIVAIGGETLTFRLTVAANGKESTDMISVTVVNVNHPPVADAGDDVSVAEGSPVTLLGSDSFDIDNDTFSYTWVQISGPIAVLIGANTATPTLTAPIISAGGVPGVVASLVFELTVNDGFSADAPAPGYTFANNVDTVIVDITNVNNGPTAEAGLNQTVDENSVVTLDGSASTDPDSDQLSYSWTQVLGTPVVITGADTAAPNFTAPFVGQGGDNLTFAVTVADGYGGTSSDNVVVHVQNINDPPFVVGAAPTIDSLWPPNHRLVSVGILGVSDPDSNTTITITAVTQDEPTDGLGDGDTAIDAVINANGTVLLRAERDGGGNGRVYHIHFTASDLEGSVSGVVTVTVPKSRKSLVVDGGELHVSTN